MNYQSLTFTLYDIDTRARALMRPMGGEGERVSCRVGFRVVVPNTGSPTLADSMHFIVVNALNDAQLRLLRVVHVGHP